LEVAPDRARRLIDRDAHDEEVDVVAEPLLRGRDPRFERGAERAPRRPELQEDRLPADVIGQVDGRAVEVLDHDGFRARTERQPDLLRSGRVWEQRAGQEREPEDTRGAGRPAGHPAPGTMPGRRVRFEGQAHGRLTSILESHRTLHAWKA